MKYKTTKVVSEEVTVVTCDLCKREIFGAWKCKCLICGRDVCEECSYPTDDRFIPNQYDGDYSSYDICKPCWLKGKNFLNKLEESNVKLKDAEAEHLKEKNNIIKEWVNYVKN